MNDWKNLVGIQPGVCGSRPTIIGSRVEVRHVLGWLSLGMSPQDINREYPYVSVEQVMACLCFAADMLDPSNPARIQLWAK